MTPKRPGNGSALARLEVVGGHASELTHIAWIREFYSHLGSYFPDTCSDFEDIIHTVRPVVHDAVLRSQSIPNLNEVLGSHLERMKGFVREAFAGVLPKSEPRNYGELVCNREPFDGLRLVDIRKFTQGFRNRIADFYIFSHKIAYDISRSSSSGSAFKPLHDLDEETQNLIVRELFFDGCRVLEGLRKHGFNVSGDDLGETSPVFFYDAQDLCLALEFLASGVINFPDFSRDKRQTIEATQAVIKSAILLAERCSKGYDWAQIHRGEVAQVDPPASASANPPEEVFSKPQLRVFQGGRNGKPGTDSVVTDELGGHPCEGPRLSLVD